MRHRRRLRGDDLPIRAEINVTSLVDIAFVLLIIFVITAPMLQGGIEINLPRGDVQPLPSADNSFMVSVRADGQVFLENTLLTMEEFQQSFPQLASGGKFEQVYIRGDTMARYGAVMHVVDVVYRTGKPFSFVAIDNEER